MPKMVANGENVKFVDCIFVMDDNDPGRRLGEAILAANGVRFRGALRNPEAATTVRTLAVSRNAALC